MSVYDTDVALQHTSYAQLLAANARAARARMGLTQASVARRMKALGFPWYPQTCGAVERGERPLSAEEILGLTLALEITIDLLTLPPRAEEVTLPAGQVIELPGTTDLPRVWSRGWWEGDTPKFPMETDDRKETDAQDRED